MMIFREFTLQIITPTFKALFAGADPLFFSQPFAGLETPEKQNTVVGGDGRAMRWSR